MLAGFDISQMGLKDLNELFEYFKSILNAIDEGIHVINRDGITIFYNYAASQFEGTDINEVIGKHILEVFPSLTRETSTLLRVVETGKPIYNYQQTFVNYKGKNITTLNSTMPVLYNGRVIGALEVSKDITKVKELAEKVVDLQAELYSFKKNRNKETNGIIKYTFDDIIGESPEIQKVKNIAKRIAMTNTPVLIYGETGTGKELFVQSIHNASLRRDKPFIAQNCAALPKNLLEGILFGTIKGGFTGAEDRPGLFELADGGTFFLDEINSMDLELQSKLLRVLEEGYIRRVGDTKLRKVDVRVIAAMNIHPQEALKNKLIREDLYFRLSVVNLYLPPLRDRKNDIPVFIDHFIKKYNRELGFSIRGVSSEVREAFMRYSWPGNVRELENVLLGAMSICEDDIIKLENIPENIRFFCGNGDVKDTKKEFSELMPLRDAVEELEKNLIIKALKQSHGNISHAASLLSIPRQTLQYKIKNLNLSGILDAYK